MTPKSMQISKIQKTQHPKVMQIHSFFLSENMRKFMFSCQSLIVALCIVFLVAQPLFFGLNYIYITTIAFCCWGQLLVFNYLNASLYF